jgi:hypothetical protein
MNRPEAARVIERPRGITNARRSRVQNTTKDGAALGEQVRIDLLSLPKAAARRQCMSWSSGGGGAVAGLALFDAALA